MRILMFGAGVIGTLYGYILAQAGNEVTHYVRRGKKASLENGVRIHLLDGRSKKPKRKTILYDLKAVEAIHPSDQYDLVIVSVRHYQLSSALATLKDTIGDTDVLIFNGNWEGFQNLDRYLPRSRFYLGFPVAGGGVTPLGLEAALLADIRLGELDGPPTPRLQRIIDLFTHAGLQVDLQSNMLHWLWVQFAINCGITAAAFDAGGPAQLLTSIPHLHAGILAGREALAVCEARGVDVKAFEDAKVFYQPPWLGAISVWLRMKTDRPARKIMETHIAIDELQRMYHDLRATGERLEIPMPVFASLRKVVDNPRIRNPLLKG